ncbi:Phosphoribosylanthranilate isomerase [Acidisarcina polymorpha]|uniref:N-(5'-phosphoribosyl)anthranilate isomerase n=1 Tax=Acidisarcina polymorpha TaxID=2211140 RepID=A0A2Z5FWS9_9BACT|nr:phosphoribosylanthranilate isomerase [Acidisarcina polymorpha]AXC11353.1 Phosphoribosylanthranilate isomerase [Acidisarcina polymorpha]
MWIKICANTSLEDAQLAVDAGANAVGFVFAESPRRVTRTQVRAIAARLPKNIEKYGVFVHPSFDEVADTVMDCGLTGVQLHTTSDPALPLRLREHFGDMPAPKRLGILRVLHYTTDFDAQVGELQPDHAVDAVLIDSRTAKAVGGTGVAFDWRAAQSSFLRSAPHLRLIVAGGLRPENVADAVYTLQPWGVDVASGVEAFPGKKDPAKVRAFVNAVRQAAAEIEKVKLPAEA